MSGTLAAGRRTRRVAQLLAVGGACITLVAGCAADDRPPVAAWSERWIAARQLVPTDRELIEGGRRFCDDLTRTLRTDLTDLTPAPSRAIDDVADEWRHQLRTLAFECPADPTVVGDALATIRELEAEIDAVTS